MGCCRGGRRSRSGRRAPLPTRRAAPPPKAEPPAEKTRKTYKIIPVEGAHGDMAIKCLKCGMTSYNPNDVRHKYCGKCHEFHES